MNDEFMHQFYESPRPEFADVLYERISQQSQPRFPQTIATKLTFRNAAVAFMLMLLVAACVYAVVEKRWDKVGVINVAVQRTIKVDNPSLSGEPLVMEFQPECFSIEEAREILRFRFKIPAWAPDGFTFSDEICGSEELSPASDSAFLDWGGADKNTPMHLSLYNLEWFNMATQEYEVGSASTAMFGVAVPPGSYEEVQVHGQPAVLVRGDWNWEEAPWATGETSVGEYEYKWDKKRALQLYWVDGEVFYCLYTRAKVSPEDLIKMAESAQ
jgi:hypothetical protein